MLTIWVQLLQWPQGTPTPNNLLGPAEHLCCDLHSNRSGVASNCGWSSSCLNLTAFLILKSAREPDWNTSLILVPGFFLFLWTPKHEQSCRAKMVNMVLENQRSRCQCHCRRIFNPKTNFKNDTKKREVKLSYHQKKLIIIKENVLKRLKLQSIFHYVVTAELLPDQKPAAVQSVIETAPPQKWLLSTFTSTETVELTSTQ